MNLKGNDDIIFRRFTVLNDDMKEALVELIFKKGLHREDLQLILETIELNSNICLK